MAISLCILIGFVCLFVGVFIGTKIKKIDGMFIIDDTDFSTTRWTIDVKMDPKTIPNKKEIRLIVRTVNPEEDV